MVAIVWFSAFETCTNPALATLLLHPGIRLLTCKLLTFLATGVSSESVWEVLRVKHAEPRVFFRFLPPTLLLEKAP